MSEAQREAAYAAVKAAGWLTDNAWTNGHIWRSVQAALDAYEAAPAVDHDVDCEGCGQCDEALMDLDPMEKYLGKGAQ